MAQETIETTFVDPGSHECRLKVGMRHRDDIRRAAAVRSLLLPSRS
jgi:hypothetical protein